MQTGFSAGVKIGAIRLSGRVVADLVQRDAPMTDSHDPSEGFDRGVAESAKRVAIQPRPRGAFCRRGGSRATVWPGAVVDTSVFTKLLPKRESRGPIIRMASTKFRPYRQPFRP